MEITDIRITPITANKTGEGVIGYASCLVNGDLWLTSIGIIRNYLGTYEFRFPMKDSQDGESYLFFPSTEEALEMFLEALLPEVEMTFGKA